MTFLDLLSLPLDLDAEKIEGLLIVRRCLADWFHLEVKFLLGISVGHNKLGLSLRYNDRSVLIVHQDIVGLTRIVLAYC